MAHRNVKRVDSHVGPYAAAQHFICANLARCSSPKDSGPTRAARRIISCSYSPVESGCRHLSNRPSPGLFMSQLAEFVIHQRQELLRGGRVAGFDLGQITSDVGQEHDCPIFVRGHTGQCTQPGTFSLGCGTCDTWIRTTIAPLRGI